MVLTEAREIPGSNRIVIIKTATVIYCFGYEPHTFIAGLERLSLLPPMTTKVRAFRLSNNNKWWSWMSTIAVCRRAHSRSRVASWHITTSLGCLVWGLAATWRWVCVYQINRMNSLCHDYSTTDMHISIIRPHRSRPYYVRRCGLLLPTE